MPFEPGKSGNPATQWKPGQSGNPKGRPAGSLSLSSILRERLAASDGADRRQVAEQVVGAMIARAIEGDVAAAKLIWDRVEGRVPNDVRVSAKSFEEMTDAELHAEIDRMGGCAADAMPTGIDAND